MLAVAAGNTILNVPPETVKSPPKSNIAIAPLEFDEASPNVLLYINAPLAVKDADVHSGSAASNIPLPAVVESELVSSVTAVLVSCLPPAE